MTNLKQKIAQMCVNRMREQNLRGKKREEAALHFMCGAMATTAIAYGEDSKEWTQVSMLAFFVSIRGYVELESTAEEPARVHG